MKTPILLVLVAAFVVAVGSAHAQQAETTPGASAVDAYVESVPSASGVGQYVEAVPTGNGQTNPAKPGAKAGSAVADALETVVESPRYGAPRAVSPVPEAPSTNPALTTSLSESFRSAVGALGTSSDARLAGLLLVVLLTTIAAVVLSIRRGPN